MAATGFSQIDPRWASHRLGTSAISVGRAGCLLCCAASCLADCGVPTDPGRLNDWLTANFGYLGGNRFVFRAVEPFGVLLLKVRLPVRGPASIPYLNAMLGSGCVVVAMVDAQPGGALQQHWVRLLDLTEGAEQIMDPWQAPGHEIRPLASYIQRGLPAETAIHGWAVYQRDAIDLRERWVVEPAANDWAQLRTHERPADD